MPHKLTLSKVFKWVVIATIVFIVPDFLVSIGFDKLSSSIKEWIPLAKNSLGWVLPALLAFVIANLLPKQAITE